jgi:hypothetical protein
VQILRERGVTELRNETGLLQNIDRSNIQRKLIIGTWGTRDSLFYTPSCSAVGVSNVLRGILYRRCLCVTLQARGVVRL